MYGHHEGLRFCDVPNNDCWSNHVNSGSPRGSWSSGQAFLPYQRGTATNVTQEPACKWSMFCNLSLKDNWVGELRILTCMPQYICWPLQVKRNSLLKWFGWRRLASIDEISSATCKVISWDEESWESTTLIPCRLVERVRRKYALTMRFSPEPKNIKCRNH